MAHLGRFADGSPSLTKVAYRLAAAIEHEGTKKNHGFHGANSVGGVSSMRTRTKHGQYAPKCSKGLQPCNWKPFAFNPQLVAGGRFELTTFGL